MFLVVEAGARARSGVKNPQMLMVYVTFMGTFANGYGIEVVRYMPFFIKIFRKLHKIFTNFKANPFWKMDMLLQIFPL